jgi:signal transduction histidine kinase
MMPPTDITASRQPAFGERLLADVSAALAASLQSFATLRTIAHLVTSAIADYCIIDMLDEAGQPRRMVVTHADPGQQPILDALLRYSPAHYRIESLAGLLRRNESALVSSVSDDFLVSFAENGEMLRLLRQLNPTSTVIVPMAARGQMIGAILLALVGGGEGYSQADLPLVQEIARRAALALDNARLYEAAQRGRAAAEAAQRRERLLADISNALAASLDYCETLQRATALIVSSFAALVVLYVLDEQGQLRRTSVAHIDPEVEARMLKLQHEHPIVDLASDHPAAVAIRGERYVLNPRFSRAVIESVAEDEAHRERLRRMIPAPHLSVPLLARGKALGALSLGRQLFAQSFDEADVAMAEEIGRRVALAIDNARLYQEAQRAIKARETFLSVAAHELKTPLTALLGQAQLFQRRADQDTTIDERHRRSAEVIANQARRLDVLINALLDVSRLVQGHMLIDRAPFDLRAFVSEVIRDFSPLLARHRIHYTDISSPEPLIVDGDSMRLEQVLNNLLTNAVKYSPGGGRIVVQLGKSGAAATITVGDNGIGIPQAELPRLFERFYRVEGAHGRRIPGAGIGLYVVKEIVELHGGHVSVESVEGQGSAFTVALPLAT